MFITGNYDCLLLIRLAAAAVRQVKWNANDTPSVYPLEEMVAEEYELPIVKEPLGNACYSRESACFQQLPAICRLAGA